LNTNFIKLNAEYNLLSGTNKKGKIKDETEGKWYYIKDVISDALDKILEPLKRFLESNFRFALFDRKYVTEE